MNRRDFSLALAGLPFIGSFFQKEKPKYKLKAEWTVEWDLTPYKDCEGYKFWMGRDFIKTHEEVQTLIDGCEEAYSNRPTWPRDWQTFAYSRWNFNEALGDTIMEKYEALFLQVVYKLGYGHGWIVVGPEVAAVFQTATSGFEWIDSSEVEIRESGIIHGRWKLFVDEKLTNKMLLCKKEKPELEDCYVLEIENFIF